MDIFVPLIIGLVVGLIVLFSALFGIFVWNEENRFQHNEVHLLNGFYFFKPEFPEGLNRTRLYTVSDGSAVGVVAKSIDLIKGPVIKRHAERVDPDKLFFAYTFAPGSVVSLNITGSPSMRVYYKVNETVVKNNDLETSFSLSFVETAFTSYFIEVSSSNYLRMLLHQ